MAVDLWSAMLTLFLIMDPLGNLPIVVAILKNINAERRMKVLVRELLLSLVILLLFLYGGQAFLSVLGVKEEAVSIAGGIILFLIALRMIFPQFRLTQGQAQTDTNQSLDADIVTYSGRDYRVTFVDPYTRYGAGFVQAHCELLDFDGGAPVE